MRQEAVSLACRLVFVWLAFSLAACQPSPPSQGVRLALLGDIMVGRGVEAAPDSLSYLGSDLRAADLALANLESPLAFSPPSPKSSYDLCASSMHAELLAKWDLKLFSLANNHSLDCGPDGPAETRSILESSGLIPLGPGPEPVIRTINGLQLVFLAFDDVISPLDEAAAIKAIRSARSSGRLVILSVHWGNEYQAGASQRQESLARQFAEAGASLIWGHHPHVLQPAAWIQTDQGRTLVLYSLGNALFDQGGLADTRRSALILVNITSQGVQAVQVVPFLIDPQKSRIVPPDVQTADWIRERLHLP